MSATDRHFQPVMTKAEVLMDIEDWLRRHSGDSHLVLHSLHRLTAENARRILSAMKDAAP